MNAKLNIVLLGAPGSGKGTQAKRIAERYGLEHVSTGDLFRYEIANKTPLGRRAADIIGRGDLCPDDITLGMLGSHLHAHAGSRGFVFDGVPRTVAQAEMMDNDDMFKALHIDMVINLRVEAAEVEKRILKRAQLENRADDTPETVKARVRNFLALTRPLEKYYESQCKLSVIDGMQDIGLVFADICKAIDKYAADGRQKDR